VRRVYAGVWATIIPVQIKCREEDSLVEPDFWKCTEHATVIRVKG